MHKMPFYPLAIMLLIGTGGYLGCDPNTIKVPPGEEQTASSIPQYAASIPEKSPSTVLIGSFNMQRLGKSKLNKPWVMEKFAAIVTRFDVLALQEINSKDLPAVQILVDQINAAGYKYSFTISPRIGRTSYFEQYAFVFDTEKIRSGNEFSYVVQDQADLLHREPFVGRFQAITSNAQPFQFTLINIHTDPDEIKEELDVLADVYNSVRKYEYPEDDVLLLGDLNAPPQKMQRLVSIPAFVPLIVDLPTNTRKSKTLDNILVDSQTTREFTGRAGTIDLEEMFSVDQKTALEISDHLPVWAEFSIVERAVTSTAFNSGQGLVR